MVLEVMMPVSGVAIACSLEFGNERKRNVRDVPSTLAGVIGELSPPLVSPRVLAGEGSSIDP